MALVVGIPRLLERAARHLGGARVLALPLLRGLAILFGLIWLVIAPRSLPTWNLAALTALAFLVWSVVLTSALWRRPAAALRRNLAVVVVDLSFALALIRLTGGAHSALYLALLLIAALQSYFYGIRRGVGVGVVASLGYLVMAWPTLDAFEWANLAVRIAMLLGTAVGVGVLADLETAERLKVSTLTTEAQARERFIQSVVDDLGEGLIALDVAGRVRAWNRAMETRSGVPASEVMGHDLFEFFPQMQRDAWGESLRRLLRGELEEFAFEAVEHETLRGGRVVVQNLKGSLLRESGRPAGAVILVEDITERVGLERSARQAEKLAAVGTLAAGLAHELNNPIGVISSRVELMLLDAEARALPEDVREDLNVVHRHAQRVARIAQSLLSFARQSPGQRGPVDLNRVIEDTLVLVEQPVTRDGIRLKRRLSPDLPAVWGDANALQQVLMNLLTNARDAVAHAADGEIEVATAADAAGGVRVTVRDTGTGITPEALARIFDPFFTTKSSGTGLGLSISFGIIRDHQGTIDVQSRPDQGTTFVITLPGVVVAERA
jgi:PAS domain S-box-containing protein